MLFELMDLKSYFANSSAVRNSILTHCRWYYFWLRRCAAHTARHSQTCEGLVRALETQPKPQYRVAATCKLHSMPTESGTCATIAHHPC